MGKRTKQTEQQTVLRASLLDRLCPMPTADGGRRAVARESIGLQELFDSVTRDLDWLLNTKQWLGAREAESFKHVPRSILSYGLPDLTSYSWRNEADAHSVARMLEKTISRFEPRLHSVHVIPPKETIARFKSGKAASSPDAESFRLTFRVDAMLVVEPIRARFSFDTEFDFSSSQVHVRGTS